MTSKDARFPLAETAHGPRQGDEVAWALRQRAEARLRTDEAQQLEEQLAHGSPQQMPQILHELSVHQIELEMQNEELRKTHLDLEAARAQWFDLYDVAPVGYCTIGELGLIVQANLTFTALLGVARGSLVAQSFGQFIVAEDGDTFYRLRKQIMNDGTPRSCELRMVTADSAPWWAHLTINEAIAAQGVPELRIAVLDITAR